MVAPARVIFAPPWVFLFATVQTFIRSITLAFLFSCASVGSNATQLNLLCNNSRQPVTAVVPVKNTWHGTTNARAQVVLSCPAFFTGSLTTIRLFSFPRVFSFPQVFSFPRARVFSCPREPGFSSPPRGRFSILRAGRMRSGRFSFVRTRASASRLRWILS